MQNGGVIMPIALSSLENETVMPDRENELHMIDRQSCLVFVHQPFHPSCRISQAIHVSRPGLVKKKRYLGQMGLFILSVCRAHLSVENALHYYQKMLEGSSPRCPRRGGFVFPWTPLSP